MADAEIDIDAYEKVIQASVQETESHVSALWFDGEHGFTEDFNPVKSFDDAWVFVDYFDNNAPWWEGHRFYVYLSLLLKQEAEPEFRLKLSNLTKMNICKAAVLAKLDPLKFDDDRKRVIREAQENIPQEKAFGLFASSIEGVAAALKATSVHEKESPYLQAVNEKIKGLDEEDRRWRAEHDMPL